MPAVRALIVILAACALSLFTPLTPASAGGPTSALLSVPGEGRTASLYYTDAAYDDLADLVGATGSAAPADESQDGRGYENGTGVTVTWLIHDVTPWRIDRIYLEGDGAPWIATQMMTDETTSIWDGPVIWHQPTDAKALVALLDRLGVGPEAAAGARDGAVAAPLTPVEPEAEAPAASEPGSVAPGSTDDAGPSVLDSARWGLGGLAVGVLLAAAWARARATRNEDLAAELAEQAEPDAVKDWLAPVSRS